MKLAEHKIQQYKGQTYFKRREPCIAEKDTCWFDCPRCAQLSLLQQIVDGLKLKKIDLDFYCQSGVAIIQAGYLKTLIKEYEAIIEGAK